MSKTLLTRNSALRVPVVAGTRPSFDTIDSEMIYTCYDMVRDCRADRPEGWRYLISNYVPVIRKLIAHYFPEQAGDDGRVEQLIASLRTPGSSVFDSLDDVPERWFVAEMRQRVLAAMEPLAARPQPDHAPDLDAMSAAFEPLTAVEKQAVWLETMRYDAAGTGVLLRMDPKTVEKIRGRAGAMLRANLDHWNRTLLWDSGAALGRAAASAKTEGCFPAKIFLDILDGRATWSGREQAEHHVKGCWHCIDHFCRLAEVIDLLRGLEPLALPETERFSSALGLPSPKKRGWKRLFARS